MAARDSRRDCRIQSPLSLRERGLGGRAQSLLNPDAEVEDIPTLTPALSRRERVVYAGCFRLMPMPPAPLRDGEGRRKHRQGGNLVRHTADNPACLACCSPEPSWRVL